MEREGGRETPTLFVISMSYKNTHLLSSHWKEGDSAPKSEFDGSLEREFSPPF